MDPKTKIVRARGGTKETTVPLWQITVPDLWHIGMRQEDREVKEKILETWQLAHDLLRTLRELPDQKEAA